MRATGPSSCISMLSSPHSNDYRDGTRLRFLDLPYSSPDFLRALALKTRKLPLSLFRLYLLRRSESFGERNNATLNPRFAKSAKSSLATNQASPLLRGTSRAILPSSQSASRSPLGFQRTPETDSTLVT